MNYSYKFICILTSIFLIFNMVCFAENHLQNDNDFEMKIKSIEIKVGLVYKIKNDYEKCKFVSENESVADVNDEGEVFAVNKGKALITVYSESNLVEKYYVKCFLDKKDEFNTLIGECTTYFSTVDKNGKNRRWNMKKVCVKLDNQIVKPNRVFSFNKTVGPRKKKYGYKRANAYSAGLIKKEYGGGVCQAATTLYNAVMRAGLMIFSRQAHLYKVNYIDPGLDATVSYPEIDFKWKNDISNPVKIKAYIRDDSIRVLLLSKRIVRTTNIKSYEYDFSKFKTEYVFSDIYPKDGVLLRYGQKGSKGKSVRKIYEKGRLIKKVVMISKYKPMNRIIGKGSVI